MNKKPNRDIEFLYEIGSMKNMGRGWRQHLAMECANNLEHSFRVAFLALLIARREVAAGRAQSLSEEKILKMALVHDLAETRTSDLSYVQKVYVKSDEHSAANDLFEGTALTDLNTEVLHEYEERRSLESKFVKDADNLDIDVELRELEERGSQLPQKWATQRRMIRDQKLYTESARQIWDEIQATDPASWHMLANKWYKIPDAGK
jgi:putative hydrolases of HD superfamily